MPTVSDAGPLIHLAQIRKLFVLKALFGTVMIVPKVKREVVDEGIRLGHEDALTARSAVEEGWIEVRKPASETKRAEKLAKDENISASDAETLMLAKEQRVPVLLTDERPLSNLSKMHGLKVWNTWIILLEALARELIGEADIEVAIDELGKKRHKLKPELAKEILEAAKRISASRLLSQK